MIPDNACTLRITAAAGTELAGAYSQGTVKPEKLKPSSLAKGVYAPKGCHPPRGVAASGLPPLRNIPHCCLP